MYGNAYFAKTLGWGRSLDDITRMLGMNASPQGPEDPAFASAVAAWLSRTPGLEVDGVIGPRTWTRMKWALSQPALPAPGGRAGFNATPDPSRNTWLRLGRGVARTQATDPVIAALDAPFAKAGREATVTSILRTPQDQLRVILGMARQRLGLNPSFTPGDVETRLPGTGHYLWQEAWTQLLQAGYVVNPPLRAAALGGYRIGDRTYPAGHSVGPSPHTSGRAFDIGCGTHGVSPILSIVRGSAAMIPSLAEGQILGEPANNCVHVGLKPA